MGARKFTAAVAAASILVLAACSSGGSSGSDATGSADSAAATPAGEAATFANPDSPIELDFVWWGSDDRATRYNEAIDLFEEKYPNVTVTRNFQAWDDYWTARNTEAAGRALPDVLQTDLGYIGEYGSNGLFLDLTPYTDSIIDTSEYSENLLASGTVSDELVGLPISTTSLAIHYNKDLLDSLGVDYPADDMTWDEFADYLRTVNEAGGSLAPSVYGSGDYTAGFAGFLFHLMQEHKEVFTDDGGPAFTEDDVIEWLDSAADLRDDGGFFPIDRTVALAPLTPYTAGQAAVALEWSTMISNAVNALGTENLGIVPPPYGSDTEARGLAEKPGMLLSVASNTEYPEASAALVDFLANDPDVIAIFGTSRGVPATATGRAAVDPTAADSIVIDYQESIAEDLTATYPVLPTGYGSIEAKWLSLNQEVQYGTITSQEFADELFSEMSMTLGQG
ncbi:MAG TPA: sugar ABC transporter substrate-binding protein [Micrococcales bacterium]|uniref:ABC transporter substrate-binding protein n=1 Tax=Miniimonas arenae TaxID=676201 RepID=UPI000EC23326|nr:extracellular solute-binding protein [Miniimonas arenae]HCX84684.1 sugar ABC transporter substrate-binding protein [Micrococcales bacterium]